MATRQSTPRSPREGATRSTRITPQVAVFGGTPVLLPVQTVEEKFVNGAWTEVSRTEAPARYQTIVPGALVSIKTLDRHTVARHQLPEDGSALPDAATFGKELHRATSEGVNYDESRGVVYTMTVQRQNRAHSGFGMVVAVSGTAVIVREFRLRASSGWDCSQATADTAASADLLRTSVFHARRLTRVNKPNAAALVARDCGALARQNRVREMRSALTSNTPNWRYQDLVTHPRHSKGQFSKWVKYTELALKVTSAGVDSPIILDAIRSQVQLSCLSTYDLRRGKAELDAQRVTAERHARQFAELTKPFDLNSNGRRPHDELNRRIAPLNGARKGKAMAAVLESHRLATGVTLVADHFGVLCAPADTIEVWSRDARSCESVRLSPESCASYSVRHAIHTDGVSRPTFGNITHEWPDGQWKTQQLPTIIRLRHESKRFIGFCPTLSPTKGEPTIGIELEMQSVDRERRNLMAHSLQEKLAPHWSSISLSRMASYLSFEDDGSTGPGGFEMVTGYGSRGLHEQALKHVLGEDGLMWAGKLRSHSALNGECGLHVHIAKPKEAAHRTKLHYLVNSEWMQPLIKAVARRDNSRWAQRDTTFGSLKAYGESLSHNIKAYPRDKKYAVDRHERPFSSERYRLVNFQNSATVEFRAYKGSMKYSTVMACIEMSLALWRYSRDCGGVSLSAREAQGFIDWLGQPANAADTRYLRAMLHKKGWAVRMPNPNKKARPEVTVEEAVAA